MHRHRQQMCPHGSNEAGNPQWASLWFFWASHLPILGRIPDRAVHIYARCSPTRQARQLKAEDALPAATKSSSFSVLSSSRAREWRCNLGYARDVTNERILFVDWLASRCHSQPMIDDSWTELTAQTVIQPMQLLDRNAEGAISSQDAEICPALPMAALLPPRNSRYLKASV